MDFQEKMPFNWDQLRNILFFILVLDIEHDENINNKKISKKAKECIF